MADTRIHQQAQPPYGQQRSGSEEEEVMERLSLLEGKRVSIQTWLREISSLIPNGMALGSTPAYQNAMGQLEQLNREIEQLKTRRAQLRAAGASSSAAPAGVNLGREDQQRLASNLLAQLARADRKREQEAQLEQERAIRAEQERDYAKCLEEDQRHQDQERAQAQFLQDIRARLQQLQAIFSTSDGSVASSLTCKLSLRLPSICSGRRVQRSFQPTDRVQLLKYYAEFEILTEIEPKLASASAGSSPIPFTTLSQLSGFKLISSYPPTKVFSDQLDTTLDACGFSNTSTLLIVTYD